MLARAQVRTSRGESAVRLEYPRDVAQLGSAPALGAGGRGFESRHPDPSAQGLLEEGEAIVVGDNMAVAGFLVVAAETLVGGVAVEPDPAASPSD